MKSLALLALSVLLMGASPDSTPTVYTIQDFSSHPLGLVTLMTSVSATPTLITCSGDYTDTLVAPVTSMTLWGQEVDFPNPGTINLPTGGALSVVWNGATNVVTIRDEDEE